MSDEDKQDKLLNPQEIDLLALQQTVKKIPDEILIGEIAGRIQNEPNVEIRKIVQTTQASFSGPIPPPSMLAEYDDVNDGLANRIVSMAEEQQSHRHELEAKSVAAAINSETRGQNYALSVSLLIIIGSIALIAIGKEVAGSILAGGTLTGLAYIFITGRNQNTTDSKDSAESE